MPRRKTNEEFIEAANKLHNYKYDYSNVDYVNNRTKVCVVCPVHGSFFIRPDDHLHGHGCPSCVGLKKYTTCEFINKARKIHGDKYDYSKVEYVNANTKVCIICPKHGEFWQVPSHHLNNHGCKKCQYDNNIFNTINRNFIDDAKIIHDGKYDYSKVEYINNHTKVCIICPKHGKFWQTPHDHLGGHGCPYCKSSILENTVRKYLSDDNILFLEQKRFDWLGSQSLDFYLPDYNIAIECQGIQHFKAIDFFGGEKGLKNTIYRDKKKERLCNENGIIVLYYSDLNNISSKIINNRNDLIKKVREYESKVKNTA